ncbi:receptor expression-enhancing protein [Anaeramoeba flamelloides]|uniref:Receptor expression-enhancing protein n=1 Tax=Anaeramoeba flamelloides TaxID=1746091 RepID=A0ABQ8YW99_9EUKA|nr:receptor expression-enhancing protein [Anaeramoeba flamelloides]
MFITFSDDDTELLIYWTVVGFFSFLESYANILVSWLPFYYELKILFFIWLQLPWFDGSHFLWENIILPYLNKHEKKIDQQVEKGGKEAIKYGIKGLMKANTLKSKVKNEIDQMKEEPNKKDD